MNEPKGDRAARLSLNDSEKSQEIIVLRNFLNKP